MARRIVAPRSTRQLIPLLTAWFEKSELFADAVQSVITPGLQATRITTADWAAIFSDDAHSQPLLFAKPEDFWEVNDVANVSPEVVDDLRCKAEEPRTK